MKMIHKVNEKNMKLKMKTFNLRMNATKMQPKDAMHDMMQFVSASLSLIEIKLKMARKIIAHTHTM